MDKNGWLTQREETSNGASKESYTYEYDKNGNRTKETKVSSGTTETTRYTYDVLNQLTSVVDKKGTRNYAFDEFNNRTVKEEIGKETTQYTYNNLNQLVETVQGSKVTTYDYDKRGNVAEVEENGNTKQTYVFDSTNKMSKVVTYKDNTSGSGSRETVTTKYVYDGAGNRVNTKVELNGSVTSNTTYVVDEESSNNDIIMAKDSVGGKTSIFTFSDEVISVETSGNISYYRNDEKHSVADILDTAGKVKDTIEHDEYGVIANPEVVSTGGNIFAYTGHVYEESTGLYYAKARYYDAEIGRFVSEDSYRGEANDPASLNLYGYVKNNPVKYMDPSGNSQLEIAKDAIIILVFIVGSICTYIKVRADYFKTEEGKQALRSAKEAIYNQIRYTAKQFSKLLGWASIRIVTTVKKIDKAISNTISWVREHIKIPNAVVRYSTTISLPKYREVPAAEYTIAIVSVTKLRPNTYYSAYKSAKYGNIFIGPPISMKVAQGIILADTEVYGVFSFGRRETKKLMDSLGPNREDSPHGDEGFYKHYHLLKTNSKNPNDHKKAHAWFYG
ncbi:RHS repeat-associated core domain-containing protein [Anaerosporobacter mobilis DSM 15930]|jgi:RHS repeat-associated protein|uniref:RHS repeat-associated core domain-containing protein n=2 Tax=Anaerosporobacter TaxID=653683 RepID=A0A1M7MCF8_9FIRM|nr:RHS repeat-associated core domain-containing protein [Anaerosporobacter mobilis DSM 15930]